FVTSTVFDHTSILKLVEQKWNLPALTRRDAAAKSPMEGLDLDAPPAFLSPPQLPEPAMRWGDWENERAAQSRRRRSRGSQSLRRQR
ncbi:MAG TPA: hypothetical protein VH089_05660, partial [Streptosporangiaceae bacterium]|nr:hypothetical protein [Streptosporangiaceae bacterium]